MIRAERYRHISEMARTHGKDIISLEELADSLGVSMATVRRDVEEMSERGVLEKTRGGVIFKSKSVNSVDPTFDMRITVNMEEKRRIAAAAASYIKENDNIMLDSGSTVLELVKSFPELRSLNAVTYDLNVALEIIKNDHVDLMMIGGLFRRGYFGFHGYFAENALNQMHAKTAFLGADAVDLEGGAMSFNLDDVPLKRAMISNCQTAILLCDHTKFDTYAFVHVAPLRSFDLIITGKELDERYVSMIRKEGIEVQLV